MKTYKNIQFSGSKEPLYNAVKEINKFVLVEGAEIMDAELSKRGFFSRTLVYNGLLWVPEEAESALKDSILKENLDGLVLEKYKSVNYGDYSFKALDLPDNVEEFITFFESEIIVPEGVEKKVDSLTQGKLLIGNIKGYLEYILNVVETMRGKPYPIMHYKDKLVLEMNET